jgi:pyruvate/2-oxoglutarate dehydrogenase complex dihydrolipoamide acyltransferase (E2) component
MSKLKIATADGGKHEFPFGPDSQLSVTTPDGVNGNKYGSWGEVTSLELVADDQADDAVDATPAAVELAPEHGVDLAEVEGTGAEGRVTKPDVEQAIADEPEA